MASTERPSAAPVPQEDARAAPGGSAPDLQLLPGEALLETAPNVTHICHYDGAVQGVLYLTSYKLVFQPLASGTKSRALHSWKGNTYTGFRHSASPGPEVPLATIKRVEKIGGATSKRENAYGFDVHCHDFRTLRFGFPTENHARRSFFDALTQEAFPLSHGGRLFAFVNREAFGGDADGWGVYDAAAEFARQQVRGDTWRVSSANAEYGLCESYPQQFGVPASISDESLRAVAAFRSRGRLPMLVWVHPTHGVALTRSSQPRVGFTGRSADDEAYLKALRPAGAKLYIIDARPRANAIANQMSGAGTESIGVYENTELLFMNIENIHVMRDSLRSLRDHCFPFVAETGWYAKVEGTKWLDHIRLVLTAAVRIVDLMDRARHSCMVHCSDGWDRTAQLTALATMMMDPYYRTLRGFAVLVEKEWVQAGHQFALRTGQGNKNHADEQRSPIFLQFLDCVFQLTLQFPTAFEFNSYFLVTLADELHSARFGTFLFNNDKQRAEAKKTTGSVWSFVLAKGNYQVFANPAYSPTAGVLQAIPTLRRLRVWTEYYARWTPQLAREDEVVHRQWQLQTYVTQLHGKAAAAAVNV